MMTHTSLLDTFKLVVLVPIVVLFCPIGKTIAFVGLGLFERSRTSSEDQQLVLVQIAGALINLVLLLLTVRALKNLRGTKWEDAFLHRLHWVQLAYLIWGFHFYATTFTATEALNGSLYLFFLAVASFVFEGRRLYVQRRLP